MRRTTNLRTCLLISVVLITLWTAAASAKVIYVDAGAAPGGDGSSWTKAHIYLQDALNDPTPANGDEIWVAAETYKPDASSAYPRGTGDRYATFYLISGVAIYGGFPAGGGDWEQRDPGTNETILSGDIGMWLNNWDNSYHVVTSYGTNPTAILNGFTIIAGNADNENGGGMRNYGSWPTVSNCTFIGNSAYHGGGMHNDDYSNPMVINCIFSGNSARYGGGMCNITSNPTLINSIFSGNSARNGGGICNITSSPTITNSTFSNNSADVRGGGMTSNYGSEPTLTNCILWGNIAPEPDGPQISHLTDAALSISYSNLQGGQAAIHDPCGALAWGAGNIEADPLFTDSDGPDNIVGTPDDNLRPSSSSSCIDAGNKTVVPPDTADLDGDGNITERTPFDLEGNNRFLDDPGTPDSGYGSPPVVDMGAYEYTGSFGQLVAYWKLDETGGGIAYDNSGNGNHGSLYGDPKWRTTGGMTAGALEFDGIDDYVLENGGLNLNGLDGLTVALWIRSHVTGTDKGFIHFEDPHGTDDRGMRYDASGANGGGVSLIKIGVTSDSPDGPPNWPGRQQLESSSNVQTADWQHLAMTWSSGEQLKLYINGLPDTPTANEPALSGVLVGYNKVLIGRGGKYDQAGTTAMGWDGLIDDVRIYNYALSEDEIAGILCSEKIESDLDGNCKVDFRDFALFVSDWLTCNLPWNELCWE